MIGIRIVHVITNIAFELTNGVILPRELFPENLARVTDADEALPFIHLSVFRLVRSSERRILGHVPDVGRGA